jgi:hypothetical protein
MSVCGHVLINFFVFCCGKLIPEFFPSMFRDILYTEKPTPCKTHHSVANARCSSDNASHL